MNYTRKNILSMKSGTSVHAVESVIEQLTVEDLGDLVDQKMALMPDTDIRIKYAHLIHYLDRSSGENAGLAQENADLKRRLESVRNACSICSERLSNAEETLATYAASSGRARKRIDELKRKNDQLKLSRAHGPIAEEERAIWRRSMDSQKKATIELREECDQLTARNEELLGDKLALSKQMMDEHDDMVRLQEENDRLRQEKAEHAETFLDANRELRGRIEELEKEKLDVTYPNFFQAYKLLSEIAWLWRGQKEPVTSSLDGATALVRKLDESVRHFEDAPQKEGDDG